MNDLTISFCIWPINQLRKCMYQIRTNCNLSKHKHKHIWSIVFLSAYLQPFKQKRYIQANNLTVWSNKYLCCALSSQTISIKDGTKGKTTNANTNMIRWKWDTHSQCVCMSVCLCLCVCKCNRDIYIEDCRNQEQMGKCMCVHVCVKEVEGEEQIQNRSEREVVCRCTWKNKNKKIYSTVH